MLIRTITGAFITALMYLMIFFSYNPWVILSATSVLCAFSVYEICRATQTAKHKVFLVVATIISIGLIICEIPYYNIILGITYFVSIVVSLYLMTHQHVKLSSPLKSAFISLLIVLMFKAIPQLRLLENGFYYLTLAVTLSFVTDVAAYLIGRNFGKHKLSPKVSPNKTVEGSVAGVVFSVLIMVLCGVLIEGLTEVSVNYFMLCAYALLASVSGQFGDLSMSAIKRVCKIKDFGAILPGHGGILDRFDSHLFSIAFTFLFCSITGGFLS